MSDRYYFASTIRIFGREFMIYDRVENRRLFENKVWNASDRLLVEEIVEELNKAASEK